MLGVERRCQTLGVDALVVAALLLGRAREREAAGDGRDLRLMGQPLTISSTVLRGCSRHQLAAGHRTDGAGVHATAQVAADRHVAHQLATDGRLKALAHAGRAVLERQRFIAVKAKGPILPFLRMAGLGHDEVARGEQAHTVEQGAVTDDILKGEILQQRFRVHRRPVRQRREQPLDLRRKEQALSLLSQVERLDAITVAGQHEPAPGLVPQGKSKHAVEPLDEIGTFLLVEMHQHLGIAIRAEPMAARFEVPAQSGIVVDFAVAGDPHVAPLVLHRLATVRREVHDAQAPKAERHLTRRRAVQPLVVGAAVRQGLAHRNGRRLVGPARGFIDTGYAAHMLLRAPTYTTAGQAEVSPRAGCYHVYRYHGVRCRRGGCPAPGGEGAARRLEGRRSAVPLGNWQRSAGLKCRDGRVARRNPVARRMYP